MPTGPQDKQFHSNCKVTGFTIPTLPTWTSDFILMLQESLRSFFLLNPFWWHVEQRWWRQARKECWVLILKQMILWMYWVSTSFQLTTRAAQNIVNSFRLMTYRLSSDVMILRQDQDLVANLKCLTGQHIHWYLNLPSDLKALKSKGLTSTMCWLPWSMTPFIQTSKRSCMPMKDSEEQF